MIFGITDLTHSGPFGICSIHHFFAETVKMSYLCILITMGLTWI
jgi:hypothetical protein